MVNKHQRNLSAVIHVSTFSIYFIPFGNFVLPLILWISNKNRSDYVDHHGKQVLNFQISLLLYGIIIGAVSFPFAISSIWDATGFVNVWEFDRHRINFSFHDFPWFTPLSLLAGITGPLLLGLFLLNLFCTIQGTIRANEGVRYKYPITIPFIR